MPTISQKLTFDNVMKQVASGKRPNITQAAREAGYSPSTVSKINNITKSKGWKELMASIDDTELLEKVRSIALDNDKRASLAAIDMLMKLKDRYPAGKLKVTEYDEELDRLKADAKEV